jgi:formate dehydrogenase maturation protein FdhE
MQAGEWTEMRMMLDLEKQQAENRMNRIKARDAVRLRKRVNRRKYVIGGALLMAASEDPKWRKTLKELLAKVTRESDQNEVQQVLAEIQQLENGDRERLSY